MGGCGQQEPYNRTGCSTESMCITDGVTITDGENIYTDLLMQNNDWFQDNIWGKLSNVALQVMPHGLSLVPWILRAWIQCSIHLIQMFHTAQPRFRETRQCEKCFSPLRYLCALESTCFISQAIHNNMHIPITWVSVSLQ
jgi:hypothetical protein